MDSPVLIVLIIVIVAALAMLMRRGMQSDESAPGPLTVAPDAAGSPDPETGVDDAEEPAGDDPDESADPDRHALVTSEGVALAPQGTTIRLVPLLREDEAPEWLQKGIEDGSAPYSLINTISGLAAHPDRGVATGTVLSAGDFTAARVRRDAQGHWCVETLGRDGDFGFMPFGREERAREALALFEHAGIVHRPLDEHGEAVPPSNEDFEEARRRYAETEAQLAISGDEDDPSPPADWSSRR